MDLSIIIASYRTKALLRDCIESIYAQTREIQYEVVVIDNCSDDGSVEMLQADFPLVRMIANPENRGFAAANNQGFGISKGRFITMLNSDTIVVDGALQKIVRFMIGKPEASIVGCKLLNMDGSTQPSVRSFPDFWNLVCEATFLYRLFPRSPFFGRFYHSYFKYDRDIRVDWVNGACLTFRRSVYDVVGGLDERFFMFSEEVDFCRRASDAGFQTWFHHGAEIMHLWAGSSFSQLQRVKSMQASQIKYLKKHWSGMHLVGVLGAKILGLFLRVVVYGLWGILSFDKRLLEKAFHYALTLFSLETWQ